MSRGITIRDVADEASVSIATVSNAMNRPGRVSAQTRTRVLEAADKLGYVPQSTANYRAATARKRLGVIAPFASYPSYSARLNGILEVLGVDRTETIVYDHPSASRSPSPRLASLPFSGTLEGLIIMGVPVDTGLSDRILDRDLPTVLIDSSHPRFTSIVLDEAHGARLAAEHLLARGFEQFVYVTEGQVSNDYISQGTRRLSGFVQALADNGVTDDRLHRITARSGDIAAGRAAAEFVASVARSGRVGVLAGHDTLAAGVVGGLRGLGVAVPERVGVMGWDGGAIVEALGLSTVAQPLVDSGRIGAQRLMSLVRHESVPIERIILTPTLVPGITT